MWDRSSRWLSTRLRTKGLGIGFGVWVNPLEGRRVLTISFLFWTWHFLRDQPEEEDHEGDYGFM